MSVSECTGGGNKREVSWTASSIFLLLLFFWLYLGLRCCVGFSLVVVSWGYSSCGAWASHCNGLCDGLSLQDTGSRTIQCNSCGTWAL